MSKPAHLVLVGGGHAHALVLASFAAHPEPRLRISLVSPEPYATYSGMVPDVVAGAQALRAAQIDLPALARRSAAAFVAARVRHIDVARRALELNDGSHLAYDLLSCDVGAEPARTTPVDAGAPLIAVRPIASAVARLEAALGTPPPQSGRRIVVVGAGAAGTEIACALAVRLRHEPLASIVVCDAAGRPLAERGQRTQAQVERAFAELGIRFAGGAAVERVTRAGVELANADEIPADLIVWATGAGGATLFRDSGLPVDRNGCLLVGTDLCCQTHPEIFAAGDCATLTAWPDLPKAGVYAVRQAPVLAANLRAAVSGEPRRAFRPQARFLALLNTGDGRAILSYGSLAWRSGWALRLKRRIDRRFVAQLNP